MYRADKRGHLVEIVIVNPNADEKAIADQQRRELVAKLGKKRLAQLDPEVRETLIRIKPGMFSMGSSTAARRQPLQWDRTLFLTPLYRNGDAVKHIRGSQYPATLPHYARIS